MLRVAKLGYAVVYFCFYQFGLFLFCRWITWLGAQPVCKEAFKRVAHYLDQGLPWLLLIACCFLHPPTLKIGFSGKGGAQHVSLLNFHVEFTVRKDFVLLNPLWNVPVLKNQIDFWRETFVHQIPMQPH